MKSTECKSREYAELQEQMDTLKLEFDDMKSKLMLSDDDLKMAKLREEQAVQQVLHDVFIIMKPWNLEYKTELGRKCFFHKV